MNRMLGCAGLVLIAATASADARVTSIEIVKREQFAGGQTFGSVGAYEKVVGRFHGELDPKSPLNAVIVDLDKAPRNAHGMVEYSADFYILKPVELAKGNAALFYELSNRGNKGMLARFSDAAGSNDPTTAQHAGNGFLMQQGFTLFWNGWMTGLPAANNALRIELPVGDAEPAQGQRAVLEDFFDHVVDRERVADVDAERRHLSAMARHEVGGGVVANALAPSADVDLGAEREEFFRHALAEAGPAAGHQNAFAREKTVLEHRHSFPGATRTHFGAMTRRGLTACQAPIFSTNCS